MVLKIGSLPSGYGGLDVDLNKIHAENCLTTLARMPDEVIDMTLTSPPYDNLREYNGFEFDFTSISSELWRVTKPGGVVVWVVGDATIKGSETGSSFRQALRFIDLGFNLHDTMVYEKNSSTFPAKRNGSRYTQIFEYMFVLSKGKPRVANLICDKPNKWAGFKDFSGKLKNPVPDYSPRTNIWRYVTSFNGVKHPAPFPEQLAADHIATWSNVGDIIYDPFMGSGTTAKMAFLAGRNFIGSEISADYCAVANNRLDTVRMI
jgi:DNA modification methylase